MRKSVIRSVVFGSILSVTGLALIISGSVCMAPQKSYPSTNQTAYIDTYYRVNGNSTAVFEYSLDSNKSYDISIKNSEYVTLTITDGSGKELVNRTSTNGTTFKTSSSYRTTVKIENNNSYSVSFMVKEGFNLLSGNVGTYYSVGNGSKIQYSFEVISYTDYVFSTQSDRFVDVTITDSAGTTPISSFYNYTYKFNTSSNSTIVVTVKNTSDYYVSFKIEKYEEESRIGQLDVSYSVDPNTEVNYKYDLVKDNQYYFRSSGGSVDLTIGSYTISSISSYSYLATNTGENVFKIANNNSSAISFYISLS